MLFMLYYIYKNGVIMMKTPFHKYIINLVFANENILHICDNLVKKNFYVTRDEIDSVYNDVLSTAPSSIHEFIHNKQPLNIDDPSHVEFLNYYGVYEIYSYPFLKDKEDRPRYCKWIEDINWIMSYDDIMTLVNMMIFNDEDHDNISTIIQFKFKKKIGVDTIDMYKEIFWNVGNISAKEAMKYYPILRDSSAIIRMLSNGDSEIETLRESSNGINIPFYSMDSDYIKWKVGYKVKAPDLKSFLQKVQTDSMYKYEEAMKMVRSVEVSTEEGVGFEGNEVDITRTSRKNVESEKLKIAKGYVDLFIKAAEKMPVEQSEEEADFFKNLEQLTLEFVNNEKILSAKDIPGLMEDIRRDIG